MDYKGWFIVRLKEGQVTVVRNLSDWFYSSSSGSAFIISLIIVLGLMGR